MNMIELSEMGWIVHGGRVCVGVFERGRVGSRIVCFGVPEATGKRKRKAPVLAKCTARARLSRYERIDR